MKIIQNTTEFQIEGRCAVAIGKFDGIHRGHIELLRHILKQKEKASSRAAISSASLSQ